MSKNFPLATNTSTTPLITKKSAQNLKSLPQRVPGTGPKDLCRKWTNESQQQFNVRNSPVSHRLSAPVPPDLIHPCFWALVYLDPQQFSALHYQGSILKAVGSNGKTFVLFDRLGASVWRTNLERCAV